MSSIIHAERPQNFFARRRIGWLRFSGTSLGPCLASRLSASALVRPASRFEPSVFSASAAVFSDARGGSLLDFRCHASLHERCLRHVVYRVPCATTTN
jgi:hypothetical protein